jgi:predicted nucleotidyltransferase
MVSRVWTRWFDGLQRSSLLTKSSCSDAGPDSDIDLLVLFREVANPNERAAELYASLADFPRPMDILVSTSSRFERYRNAVNTVYWPASREGKVLYERAV